MDEYKVKIRPFLLQYIRNPDLKDEDDIFAEGYVNSLFAMQLVLFVEKTFNIQIENEDLSIDNFQSINALVDLISSKKRLNRTLDKEWIRLDAEGFGMKIEGSTQIHQFKFAELANQKKTG